jgi:hypothetical protein
MAGVERQCWRRAFRGNGIGEPRSVGKEGRMHNLSWSRGQRLAPSSGIRRGDKPRQAIAGQLGPADQKVHGCIEETMPDPLPKPPGRPPAEPIIIKRPPRPVDAPEVDRSPDEEEDPEIRVPPEVIPDMPPPPGPGEQAA